MAWRIEVTETAAKQLSKIGTAETRRIIKFLRQRLANLDDPRSTGKALSGELSGLWRYRVGDYRIICDIQDEVVSIVVVAIGNRRDVYR